MYFATEVSDECGKIGARFRFDARGLTSGQLLLRSLWSALRTVSASSASGIANR
jgi:hypothetical protein